MMIAPQRIILTVLLVFFTHRAHSLTTGTAHSTVQTLHQDNFEDALNDPANGLWMLKFYAPWCGHCKKLAPTLDRVAPYLQGKLSFGKIDCTDSLSKPLCDTHKVKGYPTLKIYRDGDYFDYPGKRDPDSIIEFAERMARPSVVRVGTYDEAMEKVAPSKTGKSSGVGDGVGFLVYDPTVDDTNNDLSLVLGKSKILQVFGQTARKLQHEASFGLLSSDASLEERDRFGIPTGDESQPLVFRIEDGTDPVVYDGTLSTTDLMDFCRESNVALVTQLSVDNYRAMNRRGKPLLIAVLSGSSSVHENDDMAYLRTLRTYAKTGSRRKDYLFCQMDGHAWNRFLEPFEMPTKDNGSVSLPALLVIDAANKDYWTDPVQTYRQDVGKFLDGVVDGSVQKKKIVPSGRRDGFWLWLGNVVEENIVVVLIVLIVGVLLSVVLFCVTSIREARKAKEENPWSKKRN